MKPGLLALITASLFTGGAMYITFVEQQARLPLNPQPLLSQWKKSYCLGFMMLSPLVIISALFAILAFINTYNWFWILGATFIFTNWPYTLLVIMPINKKLKEINLDPSDKIIANESQIHFLIKKWGKLHLFRWILGILATILFTLALS